MASTSSINSGSSGSNLFGHPNLAPKQQSRPNQPPPPPPLPSVPPVPPTRDSSLTISRATIKNRTTLVTSTPTTTTTTVTTTSSSSSPATTNGNGESILSQFEPMFKPLSQLPPPDSFKKETKHGK